MNQTNTHNNIIIIIVVHIYADSKMPPGAYILLRNTQGMAADMPRTMGHVRTRTYFYISPNIFYFWWKLYSCNMHSIN